MNRARILILLAATLPVAALGYTLKRGDADRIDASKAPRVRPGREVALIFVGASFCGEAANPALPRGIRALRDSVAVAAAVANKHFVSIGVSIDSDVKTGLEFLKRFDGLDEVSVGGNWLNGAAIQYIVRGIPGRLMIPQVVIVERDIRASGSVLEVGNDSLVRRVFSREILAMGASKTSGPVDRP